MLDPARDSADQGVLAAWKDADERSAGTVRYS